MKILISGFKPFLGETINPSELLIQSIKKNHPQIVTTVLPVEFQTAFTILKNKILKEQPEYVIMLGQASGRKNISLEKIALNWIQTTHPDESGFHPKKGKINAQSELALMTQFPLDEIYEKLKDQSLPIEISFSAGAYVCNDLYYKVLIEFKNLKSVFIHVPLLPDQTKIDDLRPVMEFEIMEKTISEIVENLS